MSAIFERHPGGFDGDERSGPVVEEDCVEGDLPDGELDREPGLRDGKGVREDAEPDFTSSDANVVGAKLEERSWNRSLRDDL